MVYRCFDMIVYGGCHLLLASWSSFVEKLMHVGKFKNLQHTTNIPIHLAYIKITKNETITQRTQVYPGKPSWGRIPSQNFSLDSSTKYNTNTRLAYIKITENETITERTQVYPGKPSWSRIPSQNFSLDSSTKYNTSTRL
jgi:hypothetical protein